MLCKNCGANLPESKTYCIRCGCDNREISEINNSNIDNDNIEINYENKNKILYWIITIISVIILFKPIINICKNLITAYKYNDIMYFVLELLIIVLLFIPPLLSYKQNKSYIKCFTTILILLVIFEIIIGNITSLFRINNLIAFIGIVLIVSLVFYGLTIISKKIMNIICSSNFLNYFFIFYAILALLYSIFSIILSIGFKMETVENTKSNAKKDLIKATANSVAKYYEEQLQLLKLNKQQSGFIIDAKYNNLENKYAYHTTRCISKEEAHILGLDINDYSINEACTGTNSLSDDCSDTANYSTVKWNDAGKVTITLIGKEGGNLEGLWHISN